MASFDQVNAPGSSSGRPVEHADAPPAKRRRYGQSCEACRRRKRKCQGRSDDGTSLCTYCPSVGIECSFSKYGEASRLEEAYVTTELLENFITDLSNADDATRDAKISAWIAERKSNNNSSDNGQGSKTSKAALAAKQKASKIAASLPSLVGDPPNAASPESVQTSSPRMSTSSQRQSSHPHPNARMKALLEAAGEVTTAAGPSSSSADGSAMYDQQLSPWLNAWNLSTQPQDMHPQHVEMILDAYFCWINSRYKLLDQRSFRESYRAQDGLFCSQFQLACLLASATRYVPECAHRESEMMARAFCLLGSELAKPASLNAVQGITNLVAACFFTHRFAQASALFCLASQWIHELLDKPPPYLRNENFWHVTRVYWSIYSFDRTMCLTLQQAPIMKEWPQQPALPEIDPVVDSTPWYPACFDSLQHVNANFPPQISWESSCFRFSCEAFRFLSEIIEAIYTHVPERQDHLREKVLAIESRMSNWQRSIPSQILLDPSSFHRSTFPPTHIIQFNVGLRLNWIMLYRPLIQSPNKVIEQLSRQEASKQYPGIRRACQKNVDETHVLVSLWTKLFPMVRAPFIIVYAGTMSAIFDLARLAEYQSNSNAETVAEIQSLGGEYLSILWSRLSQTLQFLFACGQLVGIPLSLQNLPLSTVNPQNHHQQPQQLNVMQQQANTMASLHSGAHLTPTMPQALPQVPMPAVPNGLPTGNDIASSALGLDTNNFSDLLGPNYQWPTASQTEISRLWDAMQYLKPVA